jgi:arsenate reductase
MRISLDPVIANRIDGAVDDLCSAFSSEFERRQISDLMDDSVKQLVDTAVVLDFLPSLAYRLTRERLNAIRRSTGDLAKASWDVVFVSLSGGGRGQIAAALTTLLSDGQVAVHSAGTAIRGEIDPGVQAVIGELGVDPNDAFAHPVTDEVLRAADVIVTMGHSVGVVEIPAHVRHEDWRVGDPVGAPLQEIRRVRSDIERRVAALLDELGVAIVDRETDTLATRRS